MHGLYAKCSVFKNCYLSKLQLDKYARFVANRIFVANTRFLRLFCPDFYTDILDLTQILRRHLNKKLAAEASAIKGPKKSQRPNFCLCGVFLAV